MMRFLTAALIACAVASSASAQQQQQQQQQTPFEQALSAKLLQEIQGGLTCSTQVIAAQAELAKAQTRIRELEVGREEKK
jgi:opacity protein-like surface antigen